MKKVKEGDFPRSPSLVEQKRFDSVVEKQAKGEENERTVTFSAQYNSQKSKLRVRRMKPSSSVSSLHLTPRSSRKRLDSSTSQLLATEAKASLRRTGTKINDDSIIIKSSSVLEGMLFGEDPLRPISPG